MIQGVLLRSTAARSAVTKAYWSEPGSKLTSVLNWTKWMGPWSKE